jgi:uncharacterized protein involved in exopolysaccharide biosynthesis
VARSKNASQKQTSTPAHASDDPGVMTDMNAFGVVGALWRNKTWIIGPVLFAAIASLAFVFLATPRYNSTAQILIERQETSFTRPERETTDVNVQLDKEAIASEVQVIMSVDIARRVIAEQGLDKLAEFNPSLRGAGPLDLIRGLLGGGGSSIDPQQLILLAFREHLSVYPMSESRVIAVEFWSEDAELSTRVANAVAEAYLEFQKAAIVETTTEASTWLQQQISDLRGKVAGAERRVEEFRSQNNLFTSTAGNSGGGTRLPTLASQELSELSTQLTQARAQRSDAQARARLINELMENGRSIEAQDVFNSAIIQRLQEERARVRAQIAELSSTLLAAHPRMLELTAQRQNIERQIRSEATRIVRGLENDAAVAAAREQQINANLEALKRNAATSNGAEVNLRALEREAAAQRELLESYLTRFREAAGRTATELAPPRARIISRATIPPKASYPNKKLIPVLAVLGTAVLSSAIVLTLELARLYASQPIAQGFGVPAVPLHPAHGALAAQDMRRREPVLDDGLHDASRAEPQAEPRSKPKRKPEDQREIEPHFQQDLEQDFAPSRTAHTSQPTARMTRPEVNRGYRDKQDDHAGPSQPVTEPVSQLPNVHSSRNWKPRNSDQLVMLAPAGRDAPGFDNLIGGVRDMADRGLQVIAVDLRPGAPLVRGATGNTAVPGLHDIQQGQAGFQESIFGDALSRMNVMGVGRSALSADLHDVEPIFKALSAAYDLVVLITPPLRRAPWQIGLGRFCDAVAMTVTDEDLADPDLERLVRRLERDGQARVDLCMDGASQAAA